MPHAAQQGVPPSGRSAASLERELKFLVPEFRSGSLRLWLDAVCTPERAYPPALVCTTYFDTPGLSLLGEKIDSDYLKTKVRIRWYASLDGDASGSPVFTEVKYRIGGRRDKIRVALDVEAVRLAATPLHAPIWRSLVDRLRTKAPIVPARLDPILSLRYARYRYLDRVSGGRVTVDQGIAVTALNESRITGRVPARLPVAVLEYKGALDDLPRHLAPAIRFGARRGSCSKYLACYQHATGLVL
jgi:VTC domain-containing protein